MAVSPEREKPPVPEEVEKRPEAPEISEDLEKAGVGTRPVQPAQVVSDTGQPLLQPTPTQVKTIQPPATQSQLASWAKGPPAAALTWFANFWTRTIKKALHFGWRIVKREGET